MSVKPFANVRRDVWLRSLPSCAPKDSERYQAWKRHRDEAQASRAQPVFPDRACACGCGVVFTPRAANGKYRPECEGAVYAARKRAQRAEYRRLREEVVALRAELQRRSA